MLLLLSLAKHSVMLMMDKVILLFFPDNEVSFGLILWQSNPPDWNPSSCLISYVISAHPLFYRIVHFIWCSEPFCYDTCWYGTYDIVTSPRFLSYFASITLQVVWKAFTPVRKAYLTHMLELLQSQLTEISCKFKAAYWIL